MFQLLPYVLSFLSNGSFFTKGKVKGLGQPIPLHNNAHQQHGADSGEFTLASLQERIRHLHDDLMKELTVHDDDLLKWRNTKHDPLSHEEIVRGSILCSRLCDLNVGLCRCKVGKSKINGAGRGLFASRFIRKGELITCYPGDALVGSHGDEDEIIRWGSHVNEADRSKSENQEENYRSAYVVGVYDIYSVLGLSWLDTDSAYLGHIANDASTLQGGEEDIARYIIESNDVANAMHMSEPIDEYHVATVATKDIAKDDEILVTYGPDYWLEHNKNNEAHSKETLPQPTVSRTSVKGGKGFG